jgi:hypothetical protein
MHARGTPEWDDGQYDAAMEQMEQMEQAAEDETYKAYALELSFLAHELMSDDPDLGAIPAHLEVVGMYDALMSYAAQWDAEQARERATLEWWGSAFEEQLDERGQG